MKGRLDQRRLLQGVQVLAARDQDLAAIVDAFGPPPLWDRPPGFPTLIHIILEQQVSLASAQAAFDRLAAALQPISPENLLALTDPELKVIGFSRQKTRYGRELARAIRDGTLDLPGLEKQNDQDAKAQLMRVKGIGPWTADIYLLTALGRPDIWPQGDLALEVAIQRVKGLAARPSPEEARTFSLAWQPWRSVAARLLWHYYLSVRE